jgi:succinoglycan biosynthesis transport protein ExoP
MNMTQFLSILRARWVLIAAIFVGVVALVMIGTSSMAKRYKATTQVLVDVRASDVTTGQAANPGFVQGYIATQVDIVTSQRVAVRVVEMLKLVPEGSDAAAVEAAKLKVAEGIQKGLSVKPARDSSVIDVVYTDTDPERAAKVVNAVAQAYIETSIRVKTDPAAKSREFFDSQSRELRVELEDAQRKLGAFQRSKGITSADERLDVETARLNELSSQVTSLQAQSIDSRRRGESARQGTASGGSVTEVMQSPLIQTLKTDQARLDARLRERSAVLGSEHPEIVRLKQELESVRARIESESASVTDSLTRSHQVNAGRLGELEASLAAQRAKVLALRQTRSELALYERDVENAQKAYDAVQARLSQTTLESRVGNSNVSVISPAEVPVRPSGPAPELLLAVSVVFGALLGTAVAVALEAMNRKVRGTHDLVAVEVPVLGSVRRVPKRNIKDRRPGWRKGGPRRNTPDDTSYGTAG